MKKVLIALLVVCSLVTTASAHSGRTDSNGGHKDNKNASGLGSYHYHCGGYPAHLHTSGYCPYTDVFPSWVEISAEKQALGIGEKVTLTAIVSPSDACSQKVNWESSDSSVVSIQNGVATAIGYGTATISASTFNDVVGMIEITVKEVTAESLSISNAPESMFVGETSKLSCLITPANVDNSTIMWASSNTEVATVSSDGEVVATGVGVTTISATASNGVSTSFDLTVQIQEVTAVVISIDNAILTPGEKTFLTATVSPENATFPELAWTSSNEEVLTVSENGEITALASGNATVTATSANGILGTIEIQIQEMPTEQETGEADVQLEDVKDEGEQTDETAKEKNDGSSAFLGFAVVAGITAIVIAKKRKR